MGLVMGAFLFTFAAIVFHQPVLHKTAYHASILALIGTPFTILFGYLDWLFFYGGAYSTPIKTKLVLAVLLFLLLLFNIRFGRDGDKKPIPVLIYYGICLLTTIGLGFMGGQILFGE